MIQYIDSQHVLIEFQDRFRYQLVTSWQKIMNGCIKNPYAPNKYGGIMGTNSEINKDSGYSISRSKAYRWWFNILQRCRDDKMKIQNHTYKNCKICDEWIYFWNFYTWCTSQSNYQKCISMESSAIDKDILVKGNKIYSPQTCTIVPKNINNLLLKHDKKRGKYPIGVTKRKSDNMFEAQCSNPIIGKYITIGLYKTEMEAFLAYKKYKEKVIKEVAYIEYQNKTITNECYQALLNYNVEITD